MALHRFTDGQPLDILWRGLDIRAVVEQALLAFTLANSGPAACLARAKVASASNVLVVQNATEPNWTTNPTAKPVYICWEQDGEYYVQIKGTYTSVQWLANAYGAIVQSKLGNSTQTTFHAGWAAMAEAVWAEINDKIKDDGKSLNVVGHSLGGAVAWMVGALAKQVKPARFVDVMTFGCPREMKGQYSGTKPGFTANIQTLNDPVTKLPLNLPPYLAPLWEQQPEGEMAEFVVTNDGSPAKANANSGELLSTPNNWFIAPHSLTAYTSYWLAAYREPNNEISPAASTQRVIDWTPAPTAPDVPPPPPPLPAPTPVLDGPQPPANNPGYLGGNMPFRVEMTFGYQKWSWSESHYWVGRDLESCWRDTYQLADLRRKCLNSVVTLESLNVVPVSADGKSTLAGGSDPSYGPQGTGPGLAQQAGAVPNSSPPWRALLVNLMSNTRLYRKAIYLRGLRNEAVPSDLAEWVTGPSGRTNLFMTAISNYLCFLCNGTCPPIGQAVPAQQFERLGYVPPGVGETISGPPATAPAPVPNSLQPRGNWSMQAIDKLKGRSSPFRIDGVKVGADRSLWIKPGKQVGIQINPPVGTLALGQRIHVHGLTGGLQGTNGDGRVLEVGTADPYLGMYRISLKQPCPCDFSYLQDGTYWNIGHTLVPHGYARIARVVTRKTGGPKFSTKGRASKRCKKC